jgi:hypothetical protein
MRTLLIGILTLLTGWGCALLRSGTPIADVDMTADTDMTVGVRSTTLTAGKDLTVGGGTDSVALWLAILSLGVAPLSYPILRKVRLWRENPGKG